ncbi:hypothetical protein IAD21_00821 [Abditibacteriota bacterium]|nr:hypothetical protein IAD21_00821 [Abditibacteriota bacterium]
MMRGENRGMKKASFSRVVSGADPVVSAFDSCGAARTWWRVILWLHGKPTAPILSEVERRNIVAEGFRFYAQLYRFLALLFWLVGCACWVVGVFETTNDALYWMRASALVGGFLWFASGLGFSGAKALRERREHARLVLCGFMVAVIAFLSGLTAALSVVVQLQTGIGAALNLCALSVVWTVGIGSYLIEVLYLVAETRLGLVAPHESYAS